MKLNIWAILVGLFLLGIVCAMIIIMWFALYVQFNWNIQPNSVQLFIGLNEPSAVGLQLYYWLAIGLSMLLVVALYAHRVPVLTHTVVLLFFLALLFIPALANYAFTWGIRLFQSLFSLFGIGITLASKTIILLLAFLLFSVLYRFIPVKNRKVVSR